MNVSNDAATAVTNGAANVYSVIFQHGGTAITATGPVELDFTVNSTDFGAAALNKKQIATDASAGQWKIDATKFNMQSVASNIASEEM